MDVQGIQGLQVIRPDEPISNKNLLIVIYSDPGVGKTSLAATAPKPFILDFDNGVERANRTFAIAKDTDRPFTLKINDYQGVYNLAFGVLEEQVKKHGYKTAVLDTGGTLLDNHLAPWLIRQDANNGNNTGGLSRGGWGALSIAFNTLINKLHAIGLHVILICHAKKDDKEIGLEMKGGSKTVVYQRADMIGYLQDKGQNRELNFNHAQGRIGKNSAGLPVMVVPDAASDQFTGFMAGVIEQTVTNMQTQTKAQTEAIEKMEQYKAASMACETYKDLEEVLQEVQGMTPIYANTIAKTVVGRWIELYAELNYQGLTKVGMVNEAMQNIKTDFPGTDPLTKLKRREAFNVLTTLTQDNFTFDKAKKQFVTIKKKQNEQPNEPADAAQTEGGKLFEPAPDGEGKTTA